VFILANLLNLNNPKPLLMCCAPHNFTHYPTVSQLWTPYN